MEIIEKLTGLFRNRFDAEPDLIQRLPGSGSSRVYYKMEGDGHVVLGAYNQDIAENRAFFYYTELFNGHRLPVPAVLAVHDDEDTYLLEYLGDVTLFDYLTRNRLGHDFTPEIVAYYIKVLQWLPKFQIETTADIDYSLAYPRHSFDRESMQWDLNYFKYYFVKLSGVRFDEQLLEDDFRTLIDFLQGAPSDYFLYRDFQSRNIMLKDGEVFFIDYQGGRKGALQYDIASLLWDAKADVPYEQRQVLLEVYLDNLSRYITVERETFKRYYYGFVLIRIMQALGSYGYRGYYEQKAHFLQSIPYALKNLQWLFDNAALPVEIPELKAVLQQMINSSYLHSLATSARKVLTVTIHSFSYRRGIPYDPTGNGGGHVFDCRILPNPGREAQFKDLTGCDEAVKAYLDSNKQADVFFSSVRSMMIQSVDNYLQRNFTSLMVNFGCTGGQHRSVYFAERTARFLRERYPELHVVVRHNEQKHLNSCS